MAMTSNQRNTAVFLAAASLTGIVAATYLSIAGASSETSGLALRLSGRISFAILLAVFIARPLQQLVKTPATAMLLRNRRLLGITFAGIHTGHLALILFQANLVPDVELNIIVNYFGVLTYLILYLMLITSFDGPARALGARRWKILHKLGLYWLFTAFLQSQLPRSLDGLEAANGLLIVLALIAIIIRMTAFFAKRR